MVVLGGGQLCSLQALHVTLHISALLAAVRSVSNCAVQTLGIFVLHHSIPFLGVHNPKRPGHGEIVYDSLELISEQRIQKQAPPHVASAATICAK